MLFSKFGLSLVAGLGILGVAAATANAGPPVRRVTPPPRVAPSTSNFANPVFTPRVLPQFNSNPGFVNRPYANFSPWAGTFNQYPSYLYNRGFYPYSYVQPVVPYYPAFPIFNYGLGYVNPVFPFGTGSLFPY